VRTIPGTHKKHAKKHAKSSAWSIAYKAFIDVNHKQQTWILSGNWKLIKFTSCSIQKNLHWWGRFTLQF
jgi:hypothetical protein